MNALRLCRWAGLMQALLISQLAYASCEVNAVDEVVIDTESQLMWSRCLHGQSGEQCESRNASKQSWVDALNKARGSEHANYKNWRLPKIEEIETLLKNCSIQKQAFPGLTDDLIWSATGNLDFNTKAWAFNLTENKREKVSRDSERNYFNFLLVRNTK